MKIQMLLIVVIGTAIFSLPRTSGAADTYFLNSTTDFPTLGNGEIEFYRDII